MSKPAPTVYYNSACPVCDAGIAGQKERMAGCNVEWIDIHQNPGATEALGTSVEQVREKLHVRDANGKILVGSTALAELWSLTPSQSWLGRLAGWPVIRPTLSLAYNVFAKFLYRWNVRKKHWQPAAPASTNRP